MVIERGRPPGLTRGMRRAVLALLIASLALPALAQSLDARRQTLAALNAQEDALAGRIGANRNALARLLGALELFDRDPPPPLLVSPGDAKDAVRGMILSRAIAHDLEARAKVLAGDADALAKVRRRAAEASGDLFAAESAIDDRQGRLDAVAKDADLLAPLEARSAGADAAGQPPPSDMAQPVAGAVAARFGGKLDSGLRADGMAWRTEAGAQVQSPTAAVVAYAGPLNGWGQVVILRAGGGCHIVISGLGKVSVTAGQTVAAAYPLGTMPTDGHTQPELYFEVRLNGGPVDPTRLMATSDKAGDKSGANFNAAGLRLRREGAE